MELSRDDIAEILRAAGEPRRERGERAREWLDDHVGLFVIIGWALLVAVLDCSSALFRMFEAAR